MRRKKLIHWYHCRFKSDKLSCHSSHIRINSTFLCRFFIQSCRAVFFSLFLITRLYSYKISIVFYTCPQKLSRSFLSIFISLYFVENYKRRRVTREYSSIHTKNEKRISKPRFSHWSIDRSVNLDCCNLDICGARGEKSRSAFEFENWIFKKFWSALDVQVSFIYYIKIFNVLFWLINKYIITIYNKICE